MELRHIFLVTAIIAISIIAIPSIYSLFIGQHTFYDTRTSVCLKCHPDIREELYSSTHHLSFTCENCHVLNTSSNSTHGNVVNPRCLDCHGTPQGVVIDSKGNALIA